MSLTEADVRAALSQIVDPNTGKDLVAGKSARNIRVDGSDISVDVELGYPAKSQIDPIRREVIAKLRALPGAGNVSANVYQKIVAHAVQRGVKTLPNVKNIIAIASGKGGVGKSTTAVNLALALAAEGASVGMLDADIYGPSQPTMLGIAGRPESRDGKSLEPMVGHGIQASSIGFMIDPDTPMVWRGLAARRRRPEAAAAQHHVGRGAGVGHADPHRPPLEHVDLVEREQAAPQGLVQCGGQGQRVRPLRQAPPQRRQRRRKRERRDLDHAALLASSMPARPCQ